MTLKVALNFDAVVEVCLETILECGNVVVFLLWNSNFQQPLIDKLVIVLLVFPARMIYVHLECEQWQLECAGDESEGFGRILLAQFSCVFPSTFCKGILEVLRLRNIS